VNAKASRLPTRSALLAEADVAEIDGPAGEDADERRHRELLPPARGRVKAREHECAEEEEGGRPQQLPEHRARVELQPGLRNWIEARTNATATATTRKRVMIRTFSVRSSTTRPRRITGPAR
jgi:hypothetical protein